MRAEIRSLTALLVAAGGLAAGTALAQAPTISDAECQGLRQRLGEHARLSEGARRALATQAAASPLPGAAAAPGPAGPARGEAIRTRLARIPAERRVLEDQRLAALLRFEFGRAADLQRQMDALDAEKAELERELRGLPAGAGAAAPASPPQVADAQRIPCQDLPRAVASVIRIRQRELGAREGQPGAIPLIGLRGQTVEAIARALAAQFAPWPEAAAQVGLLASEADGRLEGFVDVPAPDVFRLYRRGPDQALTVEVFAVPGTAASAAYGETTRRLEEAAVRRMGQGLTDLLAIRPAGPVRVVAQSARFPEAQAAFLAGDFFDAGRAAAGAARSVEFQNLRGETVRRLDMVGPGNPGVVLQRVTVLPVAGDREQWTEVVILVRPVSYWRTEAEISLSQETRTTAGVLVGSPSTSAPLRLTIER